MVATKKTMPSIALFFGNDVYWVSATAKERLAQLVPAENQAFGLDTVDGVVESGGAAAQCVRRCLESLDTPAFMGSDKVVWLRNATFLGASGRATRGEDIKTALEKLTALLKKGLLKGVYFLVTSPDVDKRSAFYKACEKLGEAREFAIAEKGYQIDQQAGAIIQSALADAGLTADGDVVAAMAEREGCDTQAIRNEVEKLKMYAGDRKRITVEDVEAVVSSIRGNQTWDLADAVAERKLGKALEILNRLLYQKTFPPLIMSVLEGRFREFLVYREAQERGWVRTPAKFEKTSPWSGCPEEAAALVTEILGKDPRTMPGFVVGIRFRQAMGFTKPEILRIQRMLLDAHRQLLTTGTDDQWLLELMLIKMLRRPSGVVSRGAADHSP